MTAPASIPSVPELIARLGSSDDALRGAAVRSAGPLGAEAVGPLSAAMGSSEVESARAAKRALWNVIHHASRPGDEAAARRRAVAQALHAALGREAAPVAVLRDLVWMLSVVGGRETVPVLAGMLSRAELREDARCGLQRIPGRRSLAALRKAMDGAPEDFATALADALRARGEAVEGHPSRKLVPVRTTTVGAKAPA